jgi:hypothetical protein
MRSTRANACVAIPNQQVPIPKDGPAMTNVVEGM